MDDDSTLMRPSEAAKALCVSRRQIYRLIGSGAVPHVKIGKNTIRLHRDVVARIALEGVTE